MSALRRQFDESQAFSRDQEERLRHSADEVEILTRHKDELEARLATLEQDYEDLLDRNLPNDEQAHDLASEGTHDIRVRASLSADPLRIAYLRFLLSG